MLGRGFGGRLAVAVALAAGLGSAAGFTQPAPQVTVNAPRKAKRGLFSGYTFSMPRLYGTKGPGISMAQQKRAARKARNVRRHKARVRG